MKTIEQLFKVSKKINEDIFDTEISKEETCQSFIGKHIGYDFWNLEIKDIKNGTCYISTMYNSQFYIGYTKEEDLKVMDELIGFGINRFVFLRNSSDAIDLDIKCHKWNPGKVEFVCDKGINIILYQPNVELINISFKGDVTVTKDNKYKVNNLMFDKCSFESNSIHTVFANPLNMYFKNCDLKNVEKIRISFTHSNGMRGLKAWTAAEKLINKKSKKDMGTLLNMGDLGNFKGSIQLFNMSTNEAHNFTHSSYGFAGKSKFDIGNGWYYHRYSG